MISFRNFDEDLRNWFSKSHPDGGWKRVNTKGEVVGDCARDDKDGDGKGDGPKPKCMSNKTRAKLSKKEKASAAKAKRKHDPNPDRKGDPILVSSTKKGGKRLIKSKGAMKSFKNYCEFDECWTGYVQRGMKKKGDRMVPNCVPAGSKSEEVELDDAELDEAEYQGRDVPLNKRLPGDVKKSKVFVKNAAGKVVKVNFGDKNMTIKKDNPARRRSFRARHNCDNPGPKTKARYWSCKAW